MTAAKDPPEYASVRLPRELVRQLGILAQIQDRTVGEIVAGMIRTKVEREFREAVKTIHAEVVGGEGRP